VARPTFLNIDLTAIQSNVALARSRAPQSKLLACVKADAYGHGIVQVAMSIAPDVDAFGVANIEEALLLRQAGIATPILLLEGVFQADELEVVVANDLWICIHAQHQIEMLEKLDADSPLNVWLKMDTGMHRLGFSPSEYPRAFKRLLNINAVASIVHMTHFACSDEVSNGYTSKQLAEFTAAIDDLPGERSIANSAAILSREDTHLDWIRPGFMLYGASPFVEDTSRDYGLRPAMQFLSEVIAIRE
ncbi:UNVERIFIED_CONTAM: hypothetical protein GTU68_042396, partial [Idotea baltica]|nr:hypothetical protein [Idotea baltica]